MKKRHLHIAFLPFVFLLLPVVQSSFHVFDIKPLKGAFIKPIKPEFNWLDWYSGKYQESVEEYAKNELGFHALFVRLNNQVDYSVYDKIALEYIVRAKSGHFMDIRNINEFSGNSYVFDAHLDRKMFQIKRLQDTLSKEGIPFLIVLEPAKARMYSELIPHQYLKDGKGISNYDRIVNNLDLLGANYLDLNAYLKLIKDTINWPIFPDVSVHWSTYGMVLSLDTLIGFTNQFISDDLIRFEINGFEIDDDARFYAEYDIGDAMNLLCKIPYKQLAYPQVTYSDHLKYAKPRALVVADSYFYNILESTIVDSLFCEFEFWYYFKSRILKYQPKETLPKPLDIKKEIRSFDIIYLMQAEFSYNDFGWDFIETLYEAYFPEDKETRYEFYVRQVLKSNKLIQLSEKEARIQNITLEKSISERAFYLFSKEFDKNKPEFRDYLIYFDHMVRNNSSMLESIRKKADEKQISLDEMIRLDAEYMYYKYFPEKKKGN